MAYKISDDAFSDGINREPRYAVRSDAGEFVGSVKDRLRGSHPIWVSDSPLRGMLKRAGLECDAFRTMAEARAAIASLA
jgi:hypothetical protein